MDQVPFACSYAPGKIPVVILLSGYCLAFMAYTDFMVMIETYVLRSRLAEAICLVVLGGVLWAIKAWRNRPLAERVGLVFQEEPDPVVRTLDLMAWTAQLKRPS